MHLRRGYWPGINNFTETTTPNTLDWGAYPANYSDHSAMHLQI